MSRLTALLALAPVPPADVDPTTGKGPEWGKAAPIGLLVLLLMGIAVFFLLRSMVRRINRVPGEFAARNRSAAGDDQVTGGVEANPADQSIDGQEVETGMKGEPGAAVSPPEPGAPGLVNERSA